MAGWLVALFASAFFFPLAFVLYRSERRAWRMVAWASGLLDEPSVPLPGRPVTADEDGMRQVTALELMDPECLGFVVREAVELAALRASERVMWMSPQGHLAPLPRGRNWRRVVVSVREDA